MMHGSSGRFATFTPGGDHAIMPNLDAFGPEERIDPNQPLVAAYLGGRPVVLARSDPRYGGRSVTRPVTLSRFRREFDLQSGRASPTYDPSLIDDWPLTHLPFGQPAAVPVEPPPPTPWQSFKALPLSEKASFLAALPFLGAWLSIGLPGIVPIALASTALIGAKRRSTLATVALGGVGLIAGFTAVGVGAVAFAGISPAPRQAP